jgi:hypothetical protein
LAIAPFRNLGKGGPDNREVGVKLIAVIAAFAMGLHFVSWVGGAFGL